MKEIKKNWTYDFYHDMINIKTFDQNLLKINKKLFKKNIDIYYNWSFTVKDFDYVYIHSVNPLYFIIGGVDGYIEERLT